jgi:hypothetical protein
MFIVGQISSQDEAIEIDFIAKVSVVALRSKYLAKTIKR